MNPREWQFTPCVWFEVGTEIGAVRCAVWSAQGWLWTMRDNRLKARVS